MTNQENSFYTTDEERIRQKTKALREQMMDSITDDGIPKKVGDLRILNEVMNSLDSQVTETATLRARVSADEQEGKYLELVTNVLKNNVSGNFGISDQNIVLEEEYIPTDIVPGEMETETKRLSLDEFIEDIEPGDKNDII